MPSVMLTLLSLLQAPERPAQLTRFLEVSIGLDAHQLAAVERGEPVECLAVPADKLTSPGPD